MITVRMDASKALTHLKNVRVYWKDKKHLDELSKILERSIDTNYAAQGRPPWKKRKRQYAHPILRETGRKRATELVSALSPWIFLGFGWVKRVKSAFYGFYHQYGKGHLPVRKSVKLLYAEKKKMYDSLRKIPQK